MAICTGLDQKMVTPKFVCGKSAVEVISIVDQIPDP